jgi:hypothetical protein
MFSEADRTADTEDRAIGEVAWDVIEAGHRVLLDRIEILVLEARQAAVGAQRQAFLCLLAVILLATSWLGLNVTAALLLKEQMSWVAVGMMLTALNTALGLGLLAFAWKQPS